MATVVSSITGFIRIYEEDKHHRRGLRDEYVHHEKSTALITRDLLSGLHGAKSQELDLDLQVPLGWEKCLDLKSGKVYIKRCSSTSSSDQVFSELNSSLSKSPLSLLGDTNLGLKLTSSPVRHSSCSYQSVCTLDKVKSALEKAEREPARKRPVLWGSPWSAASNSSSSPSVFGIQIKYGVPRQVGARCPCCLIYVLISKINGKCPRCQTMATSKRARIDLNMRKKM